MNHEREIVQVDRRRGCLSLLCIGRCRQSEPQYKELPNLHQVNEQLYRGAQPKGGGIQRLAQLGVKTIVNLRDDEERSRTEQEARAAGLRYFQCAP